jgi:hypothetical protein
MNLAIHHRGSLTTSTTSRTAERRSARTGHRSRTADYIADIALVALLAAPFMLFEAPSTLPEAVIVSRSAPITMPQPAPKATDEHATPADGR